MPRLMPMIVALGLALAAGVPARAQSGSDAARTPAPGGGGGESSPSGSDDARTPAGDDKPKNDPPPWSDLHDRLAWPFVGEDDADGPINTDRPTFTPSNVVVPRGRWQVESGDTFTYQLTPTARTYQNVVPELSNRIGIFKRTELRLIWIGQTEQWTRGRNGAPSSYASGPTDFELGTKYQLLMPDKEKPWRPVTSVIAAVDFPTGNSPLFSDRTHPTVQLVYGWQPTKKLGIAGSTNYSALTRSVTSQVTRNYYSQYSQSLVAFYSVSKKLTGFYEWYDLQRVGSGDDRPNHFMDGGLLFRPKDNIQLDARAGFGLGGHNDTFFTGMGFSIRF